MKRDLKDIRDLKDAEVPFRIFQGDYRLGLAKLPDASVDLVLTDPPYGTTAIGWDTAPDLQEFWSIVNRVLKPEGVVVSFAAQPFTTDLINSNRKNYRYELIWHKSLAVGFLDAKIRPLRAHENIVVFARKLKASTYNPQMGVGKPFKGKQTGECAHYGQKRHHIADNKGTRYPRSVLHYNNAGGVRMHPTQKPLELMKYLVRTYSNPGELVVDPFMGRGTTLMAAVETGRFAIGCEREREYCLKAAAWLSEAVPGNG